MNFLQTQKNELDIFNFIDFFLEKNEHKYSSETKKTYKTQKSKLKKFRNRLNLDQITADFLHDYEIYMINILGNNQNTVNKTFAFLKSTLNKAIDEGLLNKKQNPFNRIKIKRIAGKRDFLTKHELKKIHQLYETTQNKSIQNVCSYFLFSCYTGLRFTDIKQLKHKHIVNGIIELKQHKTNDYVRIPLNNKAKSLIETDKGNVFNVISNQKTNNRLKDIALLCNINKRLTFHVARHTFATIGISLEIPIEVISKLLGHTSIKTTQIYAKVVDDVRIKEIEKFDTF